MISGLGRLPTLFIFRLRIFVSHLGPPLCVVLLPSFYARPPPQASLLWMQGWACHHLAQAKIGSPPPTDPRAFAEQLWDCRFAFPWAVALGLPPPPHFYGPVPQLNACHCLGSVLSGALGNLRGKQRAHLHHCQSTPPPPGPALSKVEPAMRQLPQPPKPTVDKPGPQHKAHTHTREMQVIGAVKRLLPKQKQ